ncbi:MAG: hypothetical protein NTW86_17695 [Candidatus Sumerlaeota bacterium]|nr:hypothetical protein [Candidatus Sumerlaeota bacterium]
MLAEPLPNGLCQDVVSEFTERLKRCSQVDERLNRAQDWIGRALFENARKILLALDFPFREPGANDKYARIASMIPDTGFSEGGLQRDFSPHGRVEWLIERHRHDEARSLLQSHLKLNPADGVAESTLHWIEAALEDRHRLEFAESAILANDLAGAGAALLKVQIRSEFVDTMRRSLSKEIDSRAGGDSWAERVTDPRETQASNGSPDVPQQAPLDAGESFEPYRVLLDGLERLRDEVQNGDNRLAARIMASAEAEASLSQQLEEAKAIETRFAENEARALAKAEALESQLAAATDLEENLTVLCEGLRQAESALQSMMSQLAIQIEGFRQVLVASARIVAERASNSMASADPGATRSTREDIHMDRSTFGESDAPSPPQSVHGGMDFPDDLDVVKPIRIRRTQIID